VKEGERDKERPHTLYPTSDVDPLSPPSMLLLISTGINLQKKPILCCNKVVIDSNHTYNVKIFKYMKETSIYQQIEINLHMYGGKRNSFIENGKNEWLQPDSNHRHCLEANHPGSSNGPSSINSA
jgi:hypothetical protein